MTGIFGVLLGSILASRGLPSGEYALITALHSVSVMTFMFAWNALNDYMDVDIDRINRPDRPLPSGAITLASAKRGIQATGLLSVLSLMVAGYVSSIGEMGVENWIPALAIWVLALFLLFNYESGSRFSYKMKEKGLPGNFAISLSVGMVILFGAAGVYQLLHPRVWAVFLVGFLYNLAREIVKDVEDIEGDAGRDTYAMKAGPERARVVAWLILLITLASLLTPFAIGIFPKLHLVGVIPAVVVLMMVKPKLFGSEDHAAQMLIKRSMQLCLVAMLGSSLVP